MGGAFCSPAAWLPAAQAQGADSSAQTPGGEFVMLEEITVTATKRTENMQDVPIAISVLSQELVEQGNLDELNEFVDLIPNANFTKDSNTSNEISIRGSGRNLAEDEDPSVGIYRDGVYVGGLLFSTANFYDVAQVEVLRGPQAGLYGRNAVGGALNVVSQRPSHELGGSVEAQYASTQRQEYRAAVNLPVVEDTWALRVAGLYVNQDEGFDRIVNQNKYSDAVENKSARIRSLFTPNDEWEFLTTVEGLDVQGGSALGVLGPDSDTGYLDADGVIPSPLGGTRPEDTDNQYRNTPEENRLKQAQAIQEVNWRTSPGTATAIVSYRDASFDLSHDEDLTNFDISSIEYDASQESTFAELRFASDDLNGFKFVTGVSYLDEDLVLNNRYRIGSNFAGMLDGASIANLYSTGRVDALWSRVLGVPVGTPITALGLTPGASGWGGYLGDTFPVQYVNEQGLESLAVFLEASYDITDRLQVWGNVRYTEDEKTINFSQDSTECPVACVEIFNLFFNGLDPRVHFKTTNTFSNVSPGGGVNFKLSDDALLYAKVVTGFKAGGYNAIAGSAEEMPFDEEETVGYEVGAKTEWLDNRLIANAAVFLQKREDALVTILDPVMPINSLGVNAGEIENRGVELELSALPLPELQLQMALGYLDSEFKEFVAEGVDYAGNQTPRSFKYTASAIASYTQPLTDAFDLVLYASYRNGWDGYTENDNIEEMSNPEITDLRLGLQGQSWKVAGFVDNVLDNRYTTVEFGSAYTTSRHYGIYSPGRVYGLRGEFKF
ncbi:MAG TPA: TonB-dependent receptor [Steroidobacter sp.]|nr:TonB-dependent receptor [Steroidobacter sp.]